MSTYLRDASGAAALEVALWLGVLVVPVLSAVDLGYYAYQSMEVHEAAQAAAQAAENTCGPLGYIPAVENCTTPTLNNTLTTTLSNAVKTTSLGSNVTLNTASTATWEGYYCSNTTPSSASNGLTVVTSSGKNDTWGLSATTFPTPPTDCSGIVTGNTNPPGDYLVVAVSYSFKPIFGSVSVANLLNKTITATSWIRLG